MQTSIRQLLLLSVVCLALAGCTTLSTPYSGSPTNPTSPTPVATAKFGFIADGFYGPVHSYTISSSGAWTPVSTVSLASGDSITASIIVDPFGKFIFVAGLQLAKIYVFNVDPNTGALTPASVYTGPDIETRPEQMAIDPTGSFLYASNTGESSVSIFQINRTTGVLTPGSPATIVSGQSPSGIATDLTGKFLYVSNEDDGTTSMFSINQSTGALTSLTPSTISSDDSFQLRFDPTGQFLYTLQSRGEGILPFSINSSTGALTPLSASFTTTPNGPTDMLITADGKHAYVTDRDSNEISIFTADPSTGTLQPLSTIPLGGEPFTIAADPGGQFLYINCEGFGVAVMQINADASLTQIGTVNTSNEAVSVAVYPAAK